MKTTLFVRPMFNYFNSSDEEQNDVYGLLSGATSAFPSPNLCSKLSKEHLTSLIHFFEGIYKVRFVCSKTDL